MSDLRRKRWVTERDEKRGEKGVRSIYSLIKSLSEILEGIEDEKMLEIESI
jgi:predicted transcriptional regulator